MKHIDVVAAIIFYNELVLCVQRGESKFDYISKKYEFPGGKVEHGETDEQAIAREIMEELRLAVKPIKLLTTVEHQYPDFGISLKCFICTCRSDKITLTEHINYKWLPIDKISSLDWAAADVPAVDILRETYFEKVRR